LSPGTLTIILAVGAIHWFALEAQWATSKVKNGYREYGIPTGLKMLFRIVNPLLIYGAISNVLNNTGEKWVSVVLLVLVSFFIYFMPPTIRCSSEQLISIKWFGIRKTAMKWADVISVYSNPEDNSIIVRDKFDRTIVHTMYNVDRGGFLEQINSLPERVLANLNIR